MGLSKCLRRLKRRKCFWRKVHDSASGLAVFRDIPFLRERRHSFSASRLELDEAIVNRLPVKPRIERRTVVGHLRIDPNARTSL